ncbi:MAG TPA: ABC transporter substrate-binding protein [Solirubrobacterales bacterium]|nr:ABC transporter substrate-binding protein [Solirubrobacterales bacterium]
MRRRWIGKWCGVALAAAMASLALVASGAAAPSRTLHATFSSFPDYMDPQLSYTFEGWNAMYDTYIPLLTYRHAGGKAGAEVIPGLARELPQVSVDGKTYTVFLRKGLKYSNGQPVRASDFAFTIERMFRVGSGGFPFYMDIVGSERFLRRQSRAVSGISTDNRTGKIVIHLTRPRNDFTEKLALPFVALVPPGTPFWDRSADPPPATGPYAITSSIPGLGWTYERNPEWESNNGQLLPLLPSGHLDRIEVKVVRNGQAQVDSVERGKYDWMQNPPPSSRIAELRHRYLGTQFREQLTHSTYYFWMNTTKPPFNDLRVRRAVNYALDRNALARIYAGQISPSQQILPPGMPGYGKLNLYPFEMAKARAMIRRVHPADREITVWTDDESPNDEAGKYYAGTLRELGFKAHLKVLNADNYFTVIGNQATPDLDTGWSDWFEDYPHPNDFFQPLLSGESILQTNNGNFAEIDVPDLNQRIEQLDKQPGPIPEARYAALDHSYMKLAPWAPYGTRTLSTFVSKSIDLNKIIWNETFGADLTSFQFK